MTREERLFARTRGYLQQYIRDGWQYADLDSPRIPVDMALVAV